jgi:hypothetical protein
MFRTFKWEDGVGFALGIWLAISPWVLGYGEHYAATANAVLLGIILASGELMHLGRHEDAEEWLDLIAGLWLVVSPLALGFESLASASFNAIAVGLLSVMFGAWALSPLDARIAELWRGGARH